MKKIVFALMLMTAIESCKKNVNCTETDTDLPVDEAITGKWELRKSICGWSGTANFPAGNETTITFNSSGQYNATGTRIGSGAYQLSTRINSQGQVENRLYLGGNWNQEFIFSITGNTLKLDENAFAYDGCEYNYKKVP